MKNSLSMAVLALILGLSACKDDDNGPSQMSKTDAKGQITQFNASVTQDLEDFSSSEGLHALADLSNIASVDDPFGGRETTDKRKMRTFLRAKGKTFQNILGKKSTSGRSKEGDEFDFDANKGIYTWNAASEIFEKTGEANIIKIIFPTEGSTTNNGELRLNAYEEVEIYDEEWEEYYYNPTEIDAELLVDGTEVASLDLSATWDDQGFPQTAEVDAFVTPFSASVTFNNSASTNTTYSASLTRGSETLFSTSITVEYASSAKEADDLNSINGHVQVFNLKLQGTVDAKGLNEATEGEIDLNAFVHLELYANNQKAGSIVFETVMEDGFENTYAFIKYNDGSKENLEDVLEPVFDELEEMEEDLNG